MSHKNSFEKHSRNDNNITHTHKYLSLHNSFHFFVCIVLFFPVNKFSMTLVQKQTHTRHIKEREYILFPIYSILFDYYDSSDPLLKKKRLESNTNTDQCTVTSKHFERNR